ncbi:RPAP1-like protein [Kalaharituber pfeilii]|nr:RPAP1-like protein [Kalaharituber pfeilii]
MAIRGERFTLNLDHGGDLLTRPALPPQLTPKVGFIKDIVEKPTSSNPAAPSPPSTGAATRGFPEHKKRTARQSAFRLQRAQQGQSNGTPTSVPHAQLKASPTIDDLKSERQRISEENQRRIDAMSPEEIEKERKELMASLSPALIDRLLKRATLDDANVTPSGWNIEGSKVSRPMRGPEPAPVSKPSTRTATVEDENTDDEEGEILGLDERAPRTLPVGVKLEAAPPAIPIHFPAPPPAPELDPHSPDFLEQLHQKYYPDLPADPSKLSWMAPVTEDEDSNVYHPSLASVPASALRFDFKGNLLPPRTARELPVHLGLHHHSDAPNAAGYTIPELAHLARSTFPSQRCMAMQTLGRILYRLGIGAYENEDISQGLWKCMHEGRVIEGLEEAASGKYTSHMGIKAYATEALWNWQKGGGQRWKAH